MTHEKRRTDDPDDEGTDDGTPVQVPAEIAAFNEDLFKRVCNYLGEQGVLDRPNRTTRLVLDIRAGELVEVVEVEEEE
jgi:hypothetical protein